MLARIYKWLKARNWAPLVVPMFLFFFAVFVFVGSLSPSYTQCTNDNEKAASQDEKKSPYYHPAIFFNCEIGVLNTNSGAVTGVAAALLTWITYLLVRLGREQSKSTRTPLQAYMQLSHPGPIHFDERGIATLPMQAKNWGSTPGTVTRVVLTVDERLASAPLPVQPPYDETNARGIHAFLKTGQPGSTGTTHPRDPLTSREQMTGPISCVFLAMSITSTNSVIGTARDTLGNTIPPLTIRGTI